MISFWFNWANLCTAKIHSYLQGLMTISPAAINSTLTTQEIPRSTVYHIDVQTLKSSHPFFKGLRFLVHLTKRSSTLNPLLLLEKPEDSTKSLCTFKLPWDAHAPPQVSAGIIHRGISHAYFSPILLRLWQLLITVSYQLLFRLFFFYSRRAPHYIFQLLLSGFFPFLCSVASQVDSALVLNYNLMRRPLDMCRV